MTQTLDIPVYPNTPPTPVLCRPYASSSFAKLPVIEYFSPTELTLLRFRFSPNSDYICTKFNLHVFCSNRYPGSVDIYRNKREGQNSNLFSTSGTSQQRLHVMCPHTLRLHLPSERYSLLLVRRTGHGSSTYT